MRLFAIFFYCACFHLLGAIELPKHYDTIVEKLIYFKDDHFKVFYGGPVASIDGCQWVMAAYFENEEGKIQSVYEIVFVHCSPHSANVRNASIHFTTISDIDLRFKNEQSKEFYDYIKLVKESSSLQPSIILREADISNIHFPKLFVSHTYSKVSKEDRRRVVQYLKDKFQINSSVTGLEKTLPKIIKEAPIRDGILEKKSISKTIYGQKLEFEIVHYYAEDQAWKSYYLIYKKGVSLDDLKKQKRVTVRLDSGCTSGQLYRDDACDCLDQLDRALWEIAENTEEHGLVIHMPTQDGRGFGFAPKAETEIYKRGGKGRVYTTPPMDTVSAATLLYNSEDFDIRTFEGCAKILINLDIRDVKVLTDNKQKIKALTDYGINVTRKTAYVTKLSCMMHLNAKKESKNYY